PDDAAGAALDAEELVGQELGLAGVPAVGQNDHDRPPVDELWPVPVELGERLADLRPARPVADLGEPTEDLPVGAPAQVVADARETRREREGLDPAEDVLEREEKLEQEPAVEVHRPRDVAEQDEPDLLALPRAGPGSVPGSPPRRARPARRRRSIGRRPGPPRDGPRRSP